MEIELAEDFESPRVFIPRSLEALFLIGIQAG
jgi:hypothetical protein